MRGPLLIACVFAVAAVATPKPAAALPGTPPVVTYGDTGVVEQVKKRYYKNRYSRNWNKGRHYRPYAYGYRPYGYRGYGYRPYYGRNYGYYGRPGVNLWFGF